MEPYNINNCVLCKEELKEQKGLNYSCKHCFCFKCYPYILFNTIKNSNISEDFFLNPRKIESNCLLCQLGKLSSPIPFTFLSDFMNQTTTGSQPKNNIMKEIICEYCDNSDVKPAKLFCLDCNTHFCEECFKDVHKGKKFSEHRGINMDQKYQMFQADKLEIQYKCPSQKHILHSFCLDCKSSDCSICKNVDHKNHQVRPIDEIFSKNNNFKYEETKSYMSQLIDDFSKFQETLLNDADNSIKDFNKELNQVINEMIFSLNKIKSQVYEEMNLMNRSKK